MVWLLSNEDVENLLTMRDCMDAIGEAHRELGMGLAVGRPRTHTCVPTSREGYFHNLKSIDGSIPSKGVSALRLSSDIIFFPVVGGKQRKDKLPALPGGTFLGLILLFSTENGELLAILQDGYIQTARVGASSGVAAKYLARKEASVLGLFGSGSQARTQAMALSLARPIRKIKVYSPNPEHRNRFAIEMEKKIGVEIVPVSHPEHAARDSDVISAATNSLKPVVQGDWVEEGMHLTAVTVCEFDDLAYKKMDVIVTSTRLQTIISYPPKVAARAPKFMGEYEGTTRVSLPENVPELSALVAGEAHGRSSDSDITFYGSIGWGGGPGIQFAAVAHRAYELAKQKGVGRELPLEWFLEKIHP